MPEAPAKRQVRPAAERDSVEWPTAGERLVTASGGARILLIALALVSLVSGVLAALGDIDEQGGLFWDLDYYRLAATNWAETGDPYMVDGSPAGYFYSPVVTPLLARVFHGFEADRLYSLVVLLAMAAALQLSIRAARPPRSELCLCWVYSIAFANGEVIQLLVTGNLAWLVALLQAGALLAASRGRWKLFYLLVGLGCFIKPYSLALLVLPFVLGKLSRWAVLSLAPLLADTLGGLLLWPELAEHRATAIRLLVIEPLQLRYSLAGRLSRVLADLGVEASPATTIAVAVQLVLVGALAIYLRRHRPADPRSAFVLAVVVSLLAIPRQVGYDAYAFGPAVFVALWTLWEGRRSRPLGGLVLVALAVGLFKEGLVILPLLIPPVIVLANRAGGLHASTEDGGDSILAEESLRG